MKTAIPLALLAAALAAILLSPQDGLLLGLNHDNFARGAMGLAMLVYLLMSSVVRVRAAGVSRVFVGTAVWALIVLALVSIYAYREEFAEVVQRVSDELCPSGSLEVIPGGVVVVRRRGDEFLVAGRVNGHAVSFVFDTEASAVVLTAEDAAAAGLHFDAGEYQVPVMTANGPASAAPIRLDNLSVGSITERGVRALVARPGALARSLLGMTFLERLKSYGVEGAKLVLRGS